jgi:hypothetical protein
MSLILMRNTAIDARTLEKKLHDLLEFGHYSLSQF